METCIRSQQTIIRENSLVTEETRFELKYQTKKVEMYGEKLELYRYYRTGILDMVRKLGYLLPENTKSEDDYFSYLMDENDEELVKVFKDMEITNKIISDVKYKQFFKEVIKSVRE